MAIQKFISIDVDKIDGLADRLGTLAADDFADATIKALNSVTDQTYELARDRMTTSINLTDEYLRRRFTVEHASNSKLEASITASGSRPDMTRLVHYASVMTIVPRTSKARNRNRGLLGIPVGSKQQGVGVAVKPSGGKHMASAYMLRLKGSDEAYGVFRRVNGKAKQLYGPSVYQLFATQIKHLDEEITDNLEKELSDQIDKQVERIFK